jgi:hypothetical protein
VVRDAVDDCLNAIRSACEAKGLDVNIGHNPP